MRTLALKSEAGEETQEKRVQKIRPPAAKNQMRKSKNKAPASEGTEKDESNQMRGPKK